MIKSIGILGKSLSWERILDQERTKYESIDGSTDSNCCVVNRTATFLNRFGLIIIAREIVGEEVPTIINYLEAGGAILTDFLRLKTLLSDFHCYPVKSRYIIPITDSLFDNVGLIDIGQNGWAFEGPHPQIYSSSYGKGKIIALPFDFDAGLLNTSAKPKFFYSSISSLPYEKVAEVSKGELRKLVVNCLRRLLFEQGCYYTHLWYYPSGFDSVFTFRVDTDFSPFCEIERVFELAEENNLSFTWFVNTRAQARDLAKFVAWQESGQDIQLHCYEHNVFRDYGRNYANLRRGKRVLDEVGIKVIGFAGPFGEWNENLAMGLEALDFKYSSEFCLSYDDLPFYPIVKGKKSKVLQIPIHPICVGRLLEANFDFNQIFVYFRQYIDSQKQRCEPIMIYDHPHRICQMLQLFDTLFRRVKSMKNIWLTNFTQFMEWWGKRDSVGYKASIENGQIEIITTNEDPRLLLHIIRPTGDETFLPLKNGQYPLDQLIWTKIPEPIIVDKEIERIRQGEFILRIKEFITTLNRRLKGQRS